MKKTKIHFNHKDLTTIVQQYLIPQLEQHTIFAFSGPLGVGKTTMIKEILKQSGIASIINSPTFSYVQQYKNNQGIAFNHFDLYRIADLESFINAGFDEYLVQPRAYSFIEWPEVIHELLHKKEFNRRISIIALSYDPEHPEQRFLEI